MTPLLPLCPAGDPAGALRDLHRSLALSQQLDETAGDADTYGEMGDVLTGGRDRLLPSITKI